MRTIVFAGWGGLFCVPILKKIFESDAEVVKIYSMGAYWEKLRHCRTPYYLGYKDNVDGYIQSTQQSGVYRQIKSANCQDVVREVAEANVDCIFCVGFGEVFKSETLDQFGCEVVNFHAGLLPEARGCDVSNYVIMEDHATTGVTIHRISEKVDEGEVLLKRQLDRLSGEEDYNLLQARKGYLAASLVDDMFDILAAGIAGPAPALDSSNGKYLKRMSPGSEVFLFSQTVEEIVRTVRAFSNTMNSAHFEHQGHTVYVNNACGISKSFSLSNGKPGQVIDLGYNFMVVSALDYDVLLQNILIDDQDQVSSQLMAYKLFQCGMEIQP